MSTTVLSPARAHRTYRPDSGQQRTAGPVRIAALSPVVCLLLLTLFCAFLFFYGLGAGDLWRGENLRALVAAEFLRSGDWTVPTLYGQPLFSKPPGFYAAVALVSWCAGGVSEWTARFPSALAASITVILFYWYIGRQLGRLGGLIAAAILPASFMWLDKATVAEIDMLHVAWTTAAILCFFRALESAEGRRSDAQRSAGEWLWWPAALLCVAGGFLTKWTAPIFFYGTAIPLLYLRGRMRLLLALPHLIGAGVAAVACLSWVYAAVALAGWDSFYNTVSREMLARIVPGNYGGSYQWHEVLVYPLRIFATNLPWSAFALLALQPGFADLWDERGRRLRQALNCWLWPNLVFWSFIAEHTPRHSFPMYPAFSGLAAMVWLGWLTGRRRWPVRRFSPAPALVAILVLWLAVKLVHVHFVVPSRNEMRQPRPKGSQLAAIVPKNKTLYVFQLKDRDEGILFYFGRPVRRLPGLEALPLGDGPAFCLLDEAEWRELQELVTGEVVVQMPDETGKPIVVVRIERQQASSSIVPTGLRARSF
jgi:4-amino-4-deoxy-L-arabinose transferase-like glycosyltransferase